MVLYSLTLHFISNSGGTSSSSDTYFPFFFRCRTHSVSRYSICPLTDRKSSSAQAAIAAYSLGDSRSGTCFFWFSFILIQAARIHDRLRIMIAAKHDQQIGYHRCLPLLIQRHYLVLIEPLQGHLHHANRTVYNHLARVNNG